MSLLLFKRGLFFGLQGPEHAFCGLCDGSIDASGFIHYNKNLLSLY